MWAFKGELVVDLQVLVVGEVVGVERIIMILEVEKCHPCLWVVASQVVMHCEEEEEEEEEECDMMPPKQTTSHLQSRHGFIYLYFE